jgi:Spy/CpxP family protein refolding chaperone
MRDRGDKNMRGTRMEMMMKKLQLTDDQQKKISDIRLQHQERMIDLTSELKKKELQKEKILSGDQVQRNDLLKITSEIGEVKNKIAAERVNHQMDVYNLLDANQKQTWQKMMLNMDNMRYKMRGEMMGGMRDRMRNKMDSTKQN